MKPSGGTDPAEIGLSNPGLIKTYDGDSTPVGVSVDEGRIGYPVIEYSTDGGKNWSTAEPEARNVNDSSGNKTYRFRVTSSTHDTVTGIMNVAITPATLNVIPGVNPSTVEYSTDPSDITVSFGYNGLVTSDAGQPIDTIITAAPTAVWTPAYAAGSGVGSYVVSSSGGTAAHGNYTLAHENTAVLSVIKKQNPDPEADLGLDVTHVSRVYDGQSTPVSVTSTVDGAQIEYSTDGGISWTDIAPSVRNVGDSGTIPYKVSTANYDDYLGQLTVSITPAPLHADVVLSAAEVEYGMAEAPTASISIRQSDLLGGDAEADAVADTPSLSLSPAYDPTSPVGTVHTYTAEEGATHENYTFVYGSNFFTVVKKSDPDPGNDMGLIETHVSRVYDGLSSPVRVSVDAGVNKPNIEYSLNGTTWQTDEFLFRNVDESAAGKVRYRVKSDNFEDVTGTLNVSITPAELNVLLTLE